MDSKKNGDQDWAKLTRSLMLGLCKLVLSMMVANAST